MSGVRALVEKALSAPGVLSIAELEALLSANSPSDRETIREAAYSLKVRYVGRKVSLRGLVEIGNRCAKNCLYCGIRSGNRDVSRYRLSYGEIMSAAKTVMKCGFASMVIQSGEIESKENTEFIERILRGIAEISGNGIGVTLSLGEQTEDVYARWRAAGARRYLLRIEASNPDLYAALHPSGHSFARRIECLRALRRTGYQVGTGVMIGLPGQTFTHLAEDVSFYASIDADMIGMGPFVPCRAAPLGRDIPLTPEYAAHQIELGLRMISVTRLHLHDVNIAATTALQALAPDGRERGILAGANVIMPNISDPEKCRDYLLYENKPEPDKDAWASREKLENSISAIGEKPNYDNYGDSPHYFKRIAAEPSTEKP